MKTLKKYPFNGGRYTIEELAIMLNKKPRTVRSQYRRGWDGTPKLGWGMNESDMQVREQDYEPYTEDELYEIFCLFAGEVSADEELSRLSDFMDLDIYRKAEREICEDTLYRLRRRYIANGGR